MPVSSLWPRKRTLRALASLITAGDPQLSKAAADFLSSGASLSHFRARVSVHACLRRFGKTVINAASQAWIHVWCVCVCVCVQAVECYTQALSEAGGQNQRAACSALSCLQVSDSKAGQQ